MTTLKTRVQECMRRHPEISQAAIARAAGAKPPSVVDWLNGKTLSLRLRPACKAAALFGCSPLWLGEGEGNPDWVKPETADVPAAPSQLLSPLTLETALPVVLDRLAKSPARDKLRTALNALLEDDSPEYRQRLAALLTTTGEASDQVWPNRKYR